MEPGSTPPWRVEMWGDLSAVGGVAVILLAQFIAWRIVRRISPRAVRVIAAIAFGLATIALVGVGSWLMDQASALERNAYGTVGIGGDRGMGAGLFAIFLPAIAWILGVLSLVIAAARSRTAPPKSSN